MTEEEKEKFLKRVVVEEEDIPTSKNPKQQFSESIDRYVEQMNEQIARVSEVCEAQKLTQKMVSENRELYKVSDEVFNADLGARKEQITKYEQSIAIMTERVRISKEIKDFCLNNYEMLGKLDMFFGGGLGLNETKEYIKNIIKNV